MGTIFLLLYFKELYLACCERFLYVYEALVLAAAEFEPQIFLCLHEFAIYKHVDEREYVL